MSQFFLFMCTQKAQNWIFSDFFCSKSRFCLKMGGYDFFFVLSLFKTPKFRFKNFYTCFTKFLFQIWLLLRQMQQILHGGYQKTKNDKKIFLMHEFQSSVKIFQFVRNSYKINSEELKHFLKGFENHFIKRHILNMEKNSKFCWIFQLQSWY